MFIFHLFFYVPHRFLGFLLSPVLLFLFFTNLFSSYLYKTDQSRIDNYLRLHGTFLKGVPLDEQKRF